MIQSPAVDLRLNETHCFSLWYHNMGNSFGTFSIDIGSVESKKFLRNLFDSNSPNAAVGSSWSRSTDILDWKFLQATGIFSKPEINLFD